MTYEVLISFPIIFYQKIERVIGMKVQLKRIRKNKEW